jgi:hypothetical protein
MSKINAFSHVLKQKVKARFFLMDFQLMDNLNITTYFFTLILCTTSD